MYRGFERAVQEDGVLSAFPNVNITDFIDYWVDEPGFPVLNVDVNVDTGVISLSQVRAKLIELVERCASGDQVPRSPYNIWNVYLSRLYYKIRNS